MQTPSVYTNRGTIQYSVMGSYRWQGLASMTCFDLAIVFRPENQL